MKISAYVLNTMPKTYQWHLDSLSGQYRYFAKEGIKLNVLDDKNYRVKALIDCCDYKMPKHTLNPMLRKIIRFYDFLDSGDDYGVMIDLDTMIIEGKSSKNIREFCDGNIYINHNTLEYENRKKWMALPWVQQPWSERTRLCIHQTFTDFVKTDYPKDYFFNTGFSFLSREFCEFVVQRLEDLGVSPVTKSGIKNLINLNKDTLPRFEMMGWENAHFTIHDEHLLELAINTVPNTHEIYKKIKRSDKELCCESYQIRRNNDPRDLNFGTLSKFTKHTFFHFIACKDDSVMDNIFRINQ